MQKDKWFARAGTPLGLSALLIGSALAGTVGFSACAQTVGIDTRTALGLTLYSNGNAIVQEYRNSVLPAGNGTLSFTNLPPNLSPETTLISVRNEVAALGPVIFSANSVTPARLLAAHVGEDIGWMRPATGDMAEQLVRAKLIGVEGGIILDVGGKVEVNPPGRPVFDQVPDSLAAASVQAAYRVETDTDAVLDLRYFAPGLSWRADYSVVVSEDESRFSFAPSATLMNGSTIAYPADRITLFAGDINREAAPQPRAQMMRATALSAAPLADQAPQPSTIGDYHRYTLPGAADVAANTAIKLPLAPVADVPVKKIYRVRGDRVYGGRMGRGEVVESRPNIIFTFKNDAASGLGLPLPAGVMRVYANAATTGDKAAPVGSILLGEDRIAHTAEGEEITITLGKVFDIKAERRQINFRRLNKEGAFEAEMRIRLTNPRNEPVEVEFDERLYGDWRMLKESQTHQKLSADYIRWFLAVPPNGTAMLTYKVEVRP